MRRGGLVGGALAVAAAAVIGAVVMAATADRASADHHRHTCRGRAATIVGTLRADVLTGTAGDDVIVGLAGDDVIDAGGGSDIVCGGAGSDVVRAGPGNDLVVGGSGDDLLFGASGHDRLLGRAGHDTLRAGPGRDVLRGGDGDDALRGDRGHDRLHGGEGVDELVGAAGHDFFDSGSAVEGCGDREGSEYCVHGPEQVFSSPAGTGAVLGDGGGLVTYSVEVEGRTRLDPGPVAAEIASVLGDPRSWTAAGARRFQRVDSASADVVISVASPDTVDRLCAPLRTNGWLSCRRGARLILNVDRWNGAVPHWTAGVGEYRAYLVNHEMGHFLGLGHEFCPGPGRLAPVMQQQSKGLSGCQPNGWPFPSRSWRS